MKKNLCPSWEKSGGSFCGARRASACARRVAQNVASRLFLVFLFIFSFFFFFLIVQAPAHAANGLCLYLFSAAQRQESSVFMTYLSVQPALTLVLMFLKVIRRNEKRR